MKTPVTKRMKIMKFKIVTITAILSIVSSSVHADNISNAYGLQGVEVSRVGAHVEDERSGSLLLIGIAIAAVGSLLAGIHTFSEPNVELSLDQVVPQVNPSVIGNAQISESAQARQALVVSAANRINPPVTNSLNVLLSHANARHAADPALPTRVRVGAAAAAAGSLTSVALDRGACGPTGREYAPAAAFAGGVSKLIFTGAEYLWQPDMLQQCAGVALCVGGSELLANLAAKPFEAGHPAVHAAKTASNVLSAGCLAATHAGVSSNGHF